MWKIWRCPSLEKENLKEIPLLPLRGIVIYPSMVLHLDVGRDKSVKALEKCMLDNNQILLATQKDTSIDEPTIDDIYHTGTIGQIKQMVKLPNGTNRILIEGLSRAEIISFSQEDPYFIANYEILEDERGDSVEEEALKRILINQFNEYTKISKKLSRETFETVKDIDDPGRLADII